MKTSLLLSVVFVAFIAFAHADNSSFEMANMDGHHLDILWKGRPLVRYMYAFDDSTPERRLETYKPYYHVFDMDGTLLTKGPGGLYPHHRGILIGWKKTKFKDKTYDFWHMPNVCQVHQAFIAQETGPDSALLTTLIHWLSPEKTVVIEEKRTVRVHRPDKDSSFIIDVTSELNAPTADVVLDGDPEHAGVQFRAHNEVAEIAAAIKKEMKAEKKSDIQGKATKYLFPEETINPKKDYDLPWVAASFVRGSKRYWVSELNHPTNPNPVIFSAYRDYCRFGAFFKQSIAKNESFTTQFRFVINEGPLPNRKCVQDLYEEYVR